MSGAIRPVIWQSRGVPASDGAGVRLTRVIGSPELDNIDPFLLLDLFESDDPEDYIAGFPSHPHRGFETVTYILAGRMRHRDNTGREGVIEAGGVQWMTAGRGIVHSEMPEQEEGLLRGFQLWVNLPAADKMKPPRYQEVDAGAIPLERRGPGVTVRVIAGTTSQGTVGAAGDIAVDPTYLDISLASGEMFSEPVPATHSVLMFVIDGAVTATAGRGGKPETIAARTLGVLGDGVRVEFSGRTTTSRLLLIAGRRLNEPIARAGPFVMNTREELVQAFRDFQDGRF